MRTNSRSQKQQHRGVIIPFVAVLLPVFLIMVAFAIDFGVISVAQQQLQNAADAGAVAALTAYQRNPADGDQAGLETMNAHNFLGGELEFDVVQSIHYGQFNSETNQFIEMPRESGDAIPQGAQAVRVRLIRSPENENAVNLFFAPIIGVERATVVAEAIAGGSVGCNGFIGIDSVNIGNNIRTDSYNSGNGPFNAGSNRSENGNICSNGSVRLASGANVFGNVAGSDVRIAQGSGAHIHGLISGAANIDDLQANPSPPFNDNKTIALGPPWNPNFNVNISDDNPAGDLIVDQGRHLTLQSGTYHFRDVFIRGGSRLFIEGDVEIFVDGELRLDNGTVINTDQRPREFVLNVDQGPVNLQGGNQLNAVIYAPEADVRVENDAQFSGTITGRTLELQGGAQLHYDESLQEGAGAASGPPALVY